MQNVGTPLGVVQMIVSKEPAHVMLVLPWLTSHWRNNMNTCDYCGIEVEDRYRFECPSCHRPGCPECMPAGRGVICPECEEQESNDQHTNDDGK